MPRAQKSRLGRFAPSQFLQRQKQICQAGFQNDLAIRIQPAKPAIEAPAPVKHQPQRDFGQFTIKARVILNPRQRPVNAGRLTSST